MYKNFFGLNRNPFELSPDPSFICPSEKNNEALSLIGYAISERKGFVVLTGEAGTGKTLMLRCLFESWRREGIAFANIFAPRLSVIDFLTYAASDLGIETAEMTKGNLLRAFYAFVSAQCAKGLTTVLVIDEAHQAPAHVLEEIRMLTNVETDHEKLVQVLLVGQPELDEKLDSFELRQLKQRIAVRCQLEPLHEEETRQYIEQRLRVAGVDPSTRKIFPPETIQQIHRYSRGIPRVVNSLCDQALIAACAERVQVVPVAIVDQVAVRFRLTPAGAPTAATQPRSIATSPAFAGNPGNPPVNKAEAGGQRTWLRTRRPAVVVPAVWQAGSGPGLLKKAIPFSIVAMALVVGLAFGGVALFHRSSNTLVSAVPKGSEVLGANSRGAFRPDATSPALVKTDAPIFGTQPNAGPVPAPASTPAVTSPGSQSSKLASNPGEAISRGASATAAPASVVARPSSEPAETANNPGEVPARRTIAAGVISRPIAKSGRSSVSSSEASAPTLDSQGNGSPTIDIHSLDSVLREAPAPAGGQLKETQLISSRPPVYPEWARAANIQGVVVIDALVDATGKVKEMKAISGPDPLIQPAMDALRTWKYEPARLNDQPIEMHTKVQMNFNLH